MKGENITFGRWHPCWYQCVSQQLITMVTSVRAICRQCGTMVAHAALALWLCLKRIQARMALPPPRPRGKKENRKKTHRDADSVQNMMSRGAAAKPKPCCEGSTATLAAAAFLQGYFLRFYSSCESHGANKVEVAVYAKFLCTLYKQAEGLHLRKHTELTHECLRTYTSILHGYILII